MVRFSVSLMIIERRSTPMRTLSLAFSKSSISTSFLFWRAASSAASFTRFARSAPEKPGVPRASTFSSTLAADGIDLVHEDDARRVLLPLLEQVADPRGAHAHEHLHEVRARDGEERHVRLAGDGLGQECLAGAGRSDQEDALRDLPAELLELLRVLQEIDDLPQL